MNPTAAPDATAWLQQGTTLRQQGHTEQALSCYEQALSLPDAPPAAWFNAGNALFDLGGPPADADVGVVVGGQLDTVAPLFASCRVVDELDNGVGVPNEEQGAPVAVCSGPVRPWSLLWPEVAHLD